MDLENFENDIFWKIFNTNLLKKKLKNFIEIIENILKIFPKK
jgi:uncharacterized membrane protein